MFILNGIKYPRVKDLTGRVFGYLTVIEFTGIYSRSKGSLWLCNCICGNTRIAKAKSLLKGDTTSCGCKIKHILPQGEASFNSLFYSYNKGAAKRGLEFSLEKDYFRILITSNCFYCGIEPLQESFAGCHKGDPARWKAHSRFVYNGIDRLCNSKGYIPENCVTCCKICNMAKHAMPLHEFIKWIYRVHGHLLSKGIVHLEETEEFIVEEVLENL